MSTSNDPLSPLQGDWAPTEATLGGQPMPQSLLESMSLTIDETAYTVDLAGQIDRGTISLDDSVTPPRMRIISEEGANAGSEFLAIYSFVGEVLTICYDLTGSAYPEGMVSPAGTQQFLVRYVHPE
ncbi:MAG: TIGR03067 domain-containing protein [Pseudomonadota bacterium]